MKMNTENEKAEFKLEKHQKIMAILDQIDERLQMAKEKMEIVDYNVDVMPAQLKEAINRDFDFILEQLKDIKEKLSK